jgi:hypothetical protein
MITEQEVKEKTPERFWSKIKFGEPNECWEWKVYGDKKGYPRITNGSVVFKTGENLKGHAILCSRYICEAIHGEFDPKLNALHTCDNPKCVNLTHTENMRDMIAKGRAVHIPFIGSNHGCAKLDEEKVLEIKKLLASGETHCNVGKMYNISSSLISKINKGEIWKHVMPSLKMGTRKSNTKLSI